MDIWAIGWTTCGETSAFPPYDWHPGQGSGQLFSNLATSHLTLSKWGGTSTPRGGASTYTYKYPSTHNLLPLYIYIGVTAGTSVKVPYPYPPSHTGVSQIYSEDSRPGGVTLGRPTVAVRQAATALALTCWLHLQLLLQPPIMRRTVSTLFWETACILRLQ